MKLYFLSIKHWLLFLLVLPLRVNGVNVNIDDIQYDIVGTKASVVSVFTDYRIKTSYIVPSMITYNGNEYTVDKIGSYAFEDKTYNSISRIKSIILPNTITTIGRKAFIGVQMTSMIIPESVTLFEKSSSEWPVSHNDAFKDCDLLTTLIYLPTKAPANWTATTYTYVPDKSSYRNPDASINDAHIIEMITFHQSTFTYTGKAPTTTWTNNVKGYTASFTMPTLKTDVGSYTEKIPVTFTKEGESFSTNVVYRYTIKPAPLTAIVHDATREYGEENPEIAVSYQGFVNGENENILTSKGTIVTNANSKSNVGTYSISVSDISALNYNITTKSGTLTITKAPLTVKIQNVTRLYGQNNPEFKLIYFGLKNGESAPEWAVTPNIHTDATQISPVGVYSIELIEGEAKNYEIAVTNGSLFINKAELNIVADNKSRPYFDSNPTLTYRCVGLMNGDSNVFTKEPSLTTTAQISSNAGNYPIIIKDAEATNYNINYTFGNLEIKKRTLTVWTNHYVREYKKENPAFSIEYLGFVNNENEETLISKPTAYTTATINSNVGEYPITISGGKAINYDFIYNNNHLTIEKTYQTLEWNQDFNNLEVYSYIELIAEATSGLDVTFTIVDGSGANIKKVGPKSFIECLKSGKITICAQQQGNSNYFESNKVYKTIHIQPSGITSAKTDLRVEYRIYNSHGIELKKIQKGINIFKFTNGEVKKVIIK